MKIYVVKYALTEGIVEQEAFEVAENQKMFVLTNHKHNRYPYIHRTEFGLTLAEAIGMADRMRLKKIAALERQLEKLKAMRFA